MFEQRWEALLLEFAQLPASSVLWAAVVYRREELR